MEKIKESLMGKPRIFDWIHKRYDETEFYAEVSLNTFKLNNKIRKGYTLSVFIIIIGFYILFILEYNIMILKSKMFLLYLIGIIVLIIGSIFLKED